MAGATWNCSRLGEILCTPYNHAPCHFMQSHIRKVYACLAVTCHLHLWQNDWDILRATAVTRGWNGYRSLTERTNTNHVLSKLALPTPSPGRRTGWPARSNDERCDWSGTPPPPAVRWPSSSRWCQGPHSAAGCWPPSPSPSPRLSSVAADAARRRRCCSWRCIPASSSSSSSSSAAASSSSPSLWQLKYLYNSSQISKMIKRHGNDGAVREGVFLHNHHHHHHHHHHYDN